MKCFSFELFPLALLFLFACCKMDSFGRAKEDSWPLISEDTGKRVLPSEMTEENQKLYQTLCEIRNPFFDAKDAAFSNVLLFVEETCNFPCESSTEATGLVLHLDTSGSDSQRTLKGEMGEGDGVKGMTLWHRSELDDELLSSKVTLHLRDVSLMQILQETCAGLRKVIGIHKGSLVFSNLPIESQDGKAPQSLSWPVGKHPEAIIMKPKGGEDHE